MWSTEWQLSYLLSSPYTKSKFSSIFIYLLGDIQVVNKKCNVKWVQIYFLFDLHSFSVQTLRRKLELIIDVVIKRVLKPRPGRFTASSVLFLITHKLTLGTADGDEGGIWEGEMHFVELCISFSDRSGALASAPSSGLTDRSANKRTMNVFIQAGK